MTRIGMKDVAERAGVSVATVSHVINQTREVRPQTMARVRQAMDEMGFVPNAAARQLKVGQAETIGLILSDLSDPFFVELARSIEAGTEDLGMSVLLGDSNLSAQREVAHLDFFARQRVKGLLLAPVGFEPRRLAWLARLNTPTVLLGQLPVSTPFPCVSHDDLAGGRLAIDYLASLDRRRLAFVGGPFTVSAVANRAQGASEGARRQSLDLQMIATPDLSFEEGYRVGVELLAGSHAELPDGVLAANDLLALGLIKALYMEHKIQIPQEIAVVGYGDISFAANSLLPLTSIRQPRRDIATTALRILLDLIAGKRVSTEPVLLPPELVVRESAA